MSNKVIGAAQIVAMAIFISVILLCLGIGLLILIHVCIVRRAFRRGLGNGSMVAMGNSTIGGTGRSMSKDDLEMLPSYDYVAKDKGSSSPVQDCAVCLENFKMGDKCRLLPLCNHSFHAQCVDEWLIRTPICPTCRTSAGSEKGGLVTDEENQQAMQISDSSNEFGEVQVHSWV